MSQHFGFEQCGSGFKDAAHDFGEQLRGMAEEAGFSSWDDAFARARGGFGLGQFKDFLYPRANAYKLENGDLVFEFMLPGYEEDKLSISFVEDQMVLKARAPLPAEDEATRRYEARHFQLKDIDRREYPVSAESYDQAAAHATYKSGILSVRIPRREGFADSEGFKVDIVKEGN
ncbi:MAG TPA: Hsp20 family protein [Rectinemataceae bacterium]|nr:Hsp20 family protein [Rectinemataceae bacterium]